MKRNHPQIPFARYADDGVIHCRSRKEAEALRRELTQRLAECGLRLHPRKTQIIYCKDANRQGEYPVISFDFLGYTFRPRESKNRRGKLFLNFAPAVSNEAKKNMRQRIRRENIPRWTGATVQDIAQRVNPVIRGWINYFGRFCKSGLYPVLKHMDRALCIWARRKFKGITSMKRARCWLKKVANGNPSVFFHWLWRNGLTAG